MHFDRFRLPNIFSLLYIYRIMMRSKHKYHPTLHFCIALLFRIIYKGALISIFYHSLHNHQFPNTQPYFLFQHHGISFSCKILLNYLLLLPIYIILPKISHINIHLLYKRSKVIFEHIYFHYKYIQIDNFSIAHDL